VFSHSFIVYISRIGHTHSHRWWYCAEFICWCHYRYDITPTLFLQLTLDIDAITTPLMPLRIRRHYIIAWVFLSIFSAGHQPYAARLLRWLAGARAAAIFADGFRQPCRQPFHCLYWHLGFITISSLRHWFLHSHNNNNVISQPIDTMLLIVYFWHLYY